MSLGASAVACGADGDDVGTGNSGATGNGNDNGGGPSYRAPTCGSLTEPNIEGPFFLPSSPERTDLRLGDEGIALVIRGFVLDPQCAPVAGALLDFWQADAEGDYDSNGFSWRGHQFADQDGRFELSTIVPGRYLNGATYRPAHIHVKVGAAGFQGLTTQLYFAGDPFNDQDAFIERSLIMDWTDDEEGIRRCEFDFVIARL